MATVTSKGQVTLPRKVREALGLRPGSQVEFEIGPKGVILHKRAPIEAIERWYGYLRPIVGDRTTDELIDEMRGEVDIPDDEDGSRQ